MQQLLTLGQAYARGTNTSLVTLGEDIINNWKLFARLARGMNCTAKTSEAATAWFVKNWPDDVPWPADVPDQRRACQASSDLVDA